MDLTKFIIARLKMRYHYNVTQDMERYERVWNGIKNNEWYKRRVTKLMRKNKIV